MCQDGLSHFEQKERSFLFLALNCTSVYRRLGPHTSLFHTYAPLGSYWVHIFIGLAQSRGTIYGQRVQSIKVRCCMSAYFVEYSRILISYTFWFVSCKVCCKTEVLWKLKVLFHPHFGYVASPRF